MNETSSTDVELGWRAKYDSKLSHDAAVQSAITRRKNGLHSLRWLWTHHMSGKSPNAINSCIYFTFDDMIRSRNDQTHLVLDSHWPQRTSLRLASTQRLIDGCPFCGTGTAQLASAAIRQVIHTYWQLSYGTQKFRTTMDDLWVRKDYKLSSHWSNEMSLNYPRDLIEWLESQ